MKFWDEGCKCGDQAMLRTIPEWMDGSNLCVVCECVIPPKS
jgi:hypothetical protein